MRIFNKVDWYDLCAIAKCSRHFKMLAHREYLRKYGNKLRLTMRNNPMPIPIQTKEIIDEFGILLEHIEIVGEEAARVKLEGVLHNLIDVWNSVPPRNLKVLKIINIYIEWDRWVPTKTQCFPQLQDFEYRLDCVGAKEIYPIDSNFAEWCPQLQILRLHGDIKLSLTPISAPKHLHEFELRNNHKSDQYQIQYLLQVNPHMQHLTYVENRLTSAARQRRSNNAFIEYLNHFNYHSYLISLTLNNDIDILDRVITPNLLLFQKLEKLDLKIYENMVKAENAALICRLGNLKCLVVQVSSFHADYQPALNQEFLPAIANNIPKGMQVFLLKAQDIGTNEWSTFVASMPRTVECRRLV